MTNIDESGDTADLQLDSLELDVKTLQRDHEEGRKEFKEFQAMVNRNFGTMQKNFEKIQENFRRLLLDPVVPAGRPKQLQAPTPPSVAMPDKTTPPMGQGTHQAPLHLEEIEDEYELEANFRRSRPATPVEGRRNILTVQPAKLNLSEFEGDDPDSWIQNLEQYFAAARTPIEHRTELAVSYLKGPAVQWWRGTGYAPSNVPWHKFCSYLSDRFALDYVCDIVSSFHATQQTCTIAVYVEQFEKLMNVMRRENPAIPDDYYVTSFLSGLNPYIKIHVECFKPNNMQTAVWYARRMEKAQAADPVRPYVPQPRRQAVFEAPKEALPQPLQNRNAVIQQAKQNQVCYKCREPWVQAVTA